MNKPPFPARRRLLMTSHGSIAVEERGEQGLPVLFIHGNSSSSVVFDAQLRSTLAANHRLIAIDLPGHGESADAADPKRSYTLPAFAETAYEVLDALDVKEAAVVGWSLGGHIGIEMLAQNRGIRGLMIIGSPPIVPNGWADGFRRSPHSVLGSQEEWSVDERETFLTRIFGRLPESSLRKAATRADGRARKRMFAAAAEGLGVNQRSTVETFPVPLAVVNGGADPLINLDYFDTVAYANLWEQRCYRLANLGHAPFWEWPAIFNPVLTRFLRDVELTGVNRRDTEAVEPAIRQRL